MKGAKVDGINGEVRGEIEPFIVAERVTTIGALV